MGSLDPAVHIFGAGQLFLEGMQSEAGVDALLQDTPEVPVTFEDEHVLRSGLSGADPRCNAGRACPDDRNINMHVAHFSPPLNQ